MTLETVPGSLAGKVAIVTGAGGGIGRAEAIELARAGASVVVNDIQGDSAHRVVEEITATGGSAVANHDSVATFAGGEAIVRAAITAFERLDILINNAGIGDPSGVWVGEMPEAAWDSAIAVNLKGCFTTVRHAAPIFRAQRSGVIINTSSDAGLGVMNRSAYAAAKEGVVGFTRAVAWELAQFNVRCNAVRPRALDTGLSSAAFYDTIKSFEARHGAPMCGTHPFSHSIFPRANEVGAIVTWLSTDDAAEFNGCTLSIGGGEIAIYSEPEVIRSCFKQEGWSLETLPAVKKYLCARLHSPAAAFSPEARNELNAVFRPRST